MLIVDDVAVTRGAFFETILERVLTRAQAEQLIDTPATLHATYWNQPLGAKFGSWLPTSYEWVDKLNATINAPSGCQWGLDRSRDVIPAELYARRNEVPLASHLTVEDRRIWERDLVARHGHWLAEAGIERPDPEEAFLAYRQQMGAWADWMASVAVGIAPSSARVLGVKASLIIQRHPKAVHELDQEVLRLAT